MMSGQNRQGECQLTTEQTPVKGEGVLGHRAATEVMRSVCLDSGSILKGKWHTDVGCGRKK